jgi:aminopeptidase N
MQAVPGSSGAAFRFHLQRWVMTIRAIAVMAGIAMLCTDSAAAQGIFPDSDMVRRSRDYDVLHYRIEVGFNEAERRVFGTTRIRLCPLVNGLDNIEVDAAAFSIDSVLVDGRRASVAYDSSRLVVRTGRSVGIRDTLTLDITYSCIPSKGLFFVQPDSAHPMRHRQIWTQGEDMDNHHWFPCYDYPNDKATSEVIATVPEQYQVLSNGRMVSETRDKSRKTRTFHWLQDKPHASYLIMLAAGEYTVVRDKAGKTPLLYYVYPEDSARAHLVFGRTPAMMTVFEDLLGVRYPWHQYAQIIIDDFMWGGMENTTATTMNTTLLVDERAADEMSPDGTVAHELAHQWFGDLVTCRDWQHIWLNEGFATFLENVYVGVAKGRDARENELEDMAEAIRSIDRTMGRSPIVGPDRYPTNVYSRGAWVLRMLQEVLGEGPFWRTMKEYLTRFGQRSVESREFELVVQDVTGQNLDWFFRQWIYGAGLPKLRIEKTWDDGGNMLTVRVSQVQKQDSLTGLFRLALPVEIAGDGWSRSERLRVEAADSTYAFALPSKPSVVLIDPHETVLKEVERLVPPDEAISMLRYTASVPARLEAVSALERAERDSSITRALEEASEHDGFWGVRQAAVRALWHTKTDDVKRLMMEIAASDADGRVRSAAISGLRMFPGDESGRVLEHVIRHDSSYLAIASALYAEVFVDSVAAPSVLRRALAMDSYRDIVRIAAINALRTLKDSTTAADLIPLTRPAYPTGVRTTALSAVADIAPGDQNVRATVDASASDGERWMRKEAVQALIQRGDAAAKTLLERRRSLESDKEILELIKLGLNGVEVQHSGGQEEEK